MDVVGGHGSKAGGGPSFLTYDNFILKPFQPAKPGKEKSRGQLEMEFYQHINDSNHPLKPLIPQFYGMETHGELKCLKIEDLTHGLKQPCIVDLKMGTQTYTEDAPQNIIDREKNKYPPQSIIGFRIVGMKVFRSSTGETWKSEREWCRQIKPETMPKAIEEFFFDGKVVRQELVKKLMSKLEEIEDVLRANAQWRMYGSSLLVVYDGQDADADITLKMIDFANLFEIRDGGVDEGYLHGVDRLKSCLSSILTEVH